MKRAKPKEKEAHQRVSECWVGRDVFSINFFYAGYTFDFLAPDFSSFFFDLGKLDLWVTKALHCANQAPRKEFED